MPFVIVGIVVTFLLIAVQEALAIVKVRKEVSNEVFAPNIQTGTEVYVVYRFEILVVPPRLVNEVSFALTRGTLTKDVACCESRMCRLHNVDQHSISIRTVREEVLLRVVSRNGTWFLQEGSQAGGPSVMEDFVMRW